MAQRNEQQEVVRKQAIHTERQCAQWNAPLRRVTQHKRPGWHAADDERNAREQERWNVGERDTQRGEGGPQRDGAQGVQVGLHGAELTRAGHSVSSRNDGPSSRGDRRLDAAAFVSDSVIFSAPQCRREGRGRAVARAPRHFGHGHACAPQQPRLCQALAAQPGHGTHALVFAAPGSELAGA